MGNEEGMLAETQRARKKKLLYASPGENSSALVLEKSIKAYYVNRILKPAWDEGAVDRYI